MRVIVQIGGSIGMLGACVPIGLGGSWVRGYTGTPVDTGATSLTRSGESCCCSGLRAQGLGIAAVL
jgi:hypothetical protein